MTGAVHDVITHANCGEDRLRGFGRLTWSIDLLLSPVEHSRTTVRLCDIDIVISFYFLIVVPLQLQLYFFHHVLNKDCHECTSLRATFAAVSTFSSWWPSTLFSAIRWWSAWRETLNDIKSNFVSTTSTETHCVRRSLLKLPMATPRAGVPSFVLARCPSVNPSWSLTPHRSWSKFKTLWAPNLEFLYYFSETSLTPPGFAPDTPRGADTPGSEPLS